MFNSPQRHEDTKVYSWCSLCLRGFYYKLVGIAVEAFD
jgi:hypothetical protein